VCSSDLSAAKPVFFSTAAGAALASLSFFPVAGAGGNVGVGSGDPRIMQFALKWVF
jgi:hypothetical protein